MGSMDGRVAIVTGAGRGIGAGGARLLAAEGAGAVADGGDVADFSAAEKLVRTAIDEFGKLDVLVNVAGILRDRMVFNMTEQEWDDVIRVHLKGTSSHSCSVMLKTI